MMLGAWHAPFTARLRLQALARARLRSSGFQQQTLLVHPVLVPLLRLRTVHELAKERTFRVTLKPACTSAKPLQMFIGADQAC